MYRALILLGLLAACNVPPPSPEEVAQICEEQARAAQGPTGRVSVGVNNRTGSYVSGEIGVTGDFLAGRDPQEVYSRCVMRRTGNAPYRPPVLN